MKTNIYLGIPNVMLTVLGPSPPLVFIPSLFAYSYKCICICVVRCRHRFRDLLSSYVGVRSTFYLSLLPLSSPFRICTVCYSMSWCGVVSRSRSAFNRIPMNQSVRSPQSQSHTHVPVAISPTPSTLDGVSRRRGTRAQILVPVPCLWATSVTQLKRSGWFGLVCLGMNVFFSAWRYVPLPHPLPFSTPPDPFRRP